MTDIELIELGDCIRSEQYFIETYFNTVNPFTGIGTVTLEDKQINLLNNIRGKRCVIERNEERQIGTTTALVAHALYLSLFNSNQSIVLMAKNDRHAAQMRAMYKTAFNNLPRFLKCRPKTDNRYSFELPFTRSWVHFVNSDPNCLRGFATTLLIMDDFETYSAKRQKELRRHTEYHCHATADILHV